MKFLSVFTSALLATAVTAKTFDFKSRPQKSLVDAKVDDALAVPGDNPLTYCAKPEKDILEIKKVDLSPNPPKAGTKLTVTASGTFNEDVEEGAKVHLQVKYGLITIIRQTADLCETVGNVDLKCPLKKGEMSISKDVDLPKEIPPGKYTVLADVVTKDEDKITCLTATVTFSRGGKVFFEL